MTITPKRDEYRVEDSGWMVKQICHLGIYTNIGEIPVRAAYVFVTQWAHLVRVVTGTHFIPTNIQK